MYLAIAFHYDVLKGLFDTFIVVVAVVVVVGARSQQILKIISEDYHKNITDIGIKFYAQLSTSTYIDCMASIFNSLFK